MTNSYTFTNNAMVSGVATCDTDIVNDNLQYLKFEADKIPTIQQSITTLSGSIANLQNLPINVLATTGTINLSDNSVNKITPAGTVTFSLPSVSDNTKFHQILVQVILNDTYTINIGTTYYFGKTAPDLSITGNYDLIYEYDGANWVCGALSKGEST